MTANTTIAEKLVAKAKELGLPPQSETFIRQADTAVTDAVRKTAAYTEQNREKISSALDKAERAMFDKSVDSVKGLVEACKGIEPSLK